MEKTDIKQIDFVKIYKAARKNLKLYVYGLPAVFIISCLIILSVPRYYTCTVQLAPELSSFNANSLSGIASSFGFDLGMANNSTDAIFPELYPQLMESVDFRTRMFPLSVKTIDGKITTTYYEYLKNHQKQPWWGHIKGAITRLFEKKDANSQTGGINPFMMTKQQKTISDQIGNNIVCDVDKKTFVISISVTDQDPLICATIADSAKAQLQNVITRYRTNKAKADLDYTRTLYAEAKKEYEKARRRYADFSDANTSLLLTSFKSKQDDLENDMQLKYNIYSTLTTQLQAAKAKVQERTPAFTTLQSASVPLKPAGPKRMIFVASMLLASFVGITLYAAKKENCI